MDSGLRGKNVLITGAAGGIGTALVEAFDAEGAGLVLHAHRGEEKLRAWQAEQADRGTGTKSIVVRADLRTEAQVDALFERAVSSMGRLDCLVVNAGLWVMEDVPLEELSLTQWNDTLALDLTAPFLCCRAFFRHLRDRPRDHANIVFVGSTAALFGEAGHCDYAAAKAGMVHGMVNSLKNEIVRLAPWGRVNAVCPGWVRTPMTEALASDPLHVERATRTMALRKLATAQDVARAVVVLASDHLSGHVTGAVLPVSGGMEGRTLHADPPS